MIEAAGRALAAWDLPAGTEPRPADSGLINHSFELLVGGVPVGVLQRLNTRVFVPEVHEDIEAITVHLASRAVPTPRLVHTREGRLWHVDETGGVWRRLTWIGDRTVHRLDRLQDATSAAACVARFHAALTGLQWDFRSVRVGAHDTPLHLSRLAESGRAHSAHRLAAAVAPVAAEIQERFSRWEAPGDLPVRIIHGDLKISNVRFQGDAALALIDLDTLAWGTIDIELGDALRSWCNRASEDAVASAFDVDLFEAAMRGYASSASLTEPEWASIVPGVERIALELASRFARDALEESYFGWDASRYRGRGEHNLARAIGQLVLARSVAERRGEALIRLARLRSAG